jgi:hypothetical protein
MYLKDKKIQIKKSKLGINKKRIKKLVKVLLGRILSSIY